MVDGQCQLKTFNFPMWKCDLVISESISAMSNDSVSVYKKIKPIV